MSWAATVATIKAAVAAAPAAGVEAAAAAVAAGRGIGIEDHLVQRDIAGRRDEQSAAQTRTAAAALRAVAAVAADRLRTGDGQAVHRDRTGIDEQSVIAAATAERAAAAIDRQAGPGAQIDRVELLRQRDAIGDIDGEGAGFTDACQPVTELVHKPDRRRETRGRADRLRQIRRYQRAKRVLRQHLGVAGGVEGGGEGAGVGVGEFRGGAVADDGQRAAGGDRGGAFHIDQPVIDQHAAVQVERVGDGARAAAASSRRRSRPGRCPPCRCLETPTSSRPGWWCRRTYVLAALSTSTPPPVNTMSAAVAPLAIVPLTVIVSPDGNIERPDRRTRRCVVREREARRRFERAAGGECQHVVAERDVAGVRACPGRNRRRWRGCPRRRRRSRRRMC